jgi:hypothetical protein
LASVKDNHVKLNWSVHGVCAGEINPTLFLFSSEAWVAHMGERGGIYRVLVWKPEGNRQPWRPRHRWEDDIKMALQKVGCGGMDWIKVAQDRDRWWALVNLVMNFRFHKVGGNFLTR